MAFGHEKLREELGGYRVSQFDTDPDHYCPGKLIAGAHKILDTISKTTIYACYRLERR
jgi:hypothetical protein